MAKGLLISMRLADSVVVKSDCYVVGKSLLETLHSKEGDMRRPPVELSPDKVAAKHCYMHQGQCRYLIVGYRQSLLIVVFWRAEADMLGEDPCNIQSPSNVPIYTTNMQPTRANRSCPWIF